MASEDRSLAQVVTGEVDGGVTWRDSMIRVVVSGIQVGCVVGGGRLRALIDHCYQQPNASILEGFDRRIMSLLLHLVME